MVPGDVLLDLIAGEPLAELHEYAACGVVYALQVAAEATGVELCGQFVPEGIAPEGCDGVGLLAEATAVVGEVGGCAADGLAVREDIPEAFSYSDDGVHSGWCVDRVLCLDGVLRGEG